MLQNPILNPIRFYKGTDLPNYATRWPNMDNVSFHHEWQTGVFAAQYYKDFVLNKEIGLQFRVDGISNENIDVYKLNEASGVFQPYDTLIPEDISPLGWLGYKVNKYTFTPSETGIYYFYFEEAEYLSDKFIVHNDVKFLSRLVELKYYNYENDYGMVYWDNDVSKYEGLTYYTGQLLFLETANIISQYSSDRGNVEKLRSTPQRSSSLNLTDVHYTSIDNINMIFSNSYTEVNGIPYQSIEAPSIAKILNSDLVNISVKLYQTENDYFTKEI